jgi:CRP-like cAMP-binding protein
MNGIIKYLSNKIDVSSEVIEYILSISKQKKIQKGDILVSQGDKVNFIYFVEDGCLRSYTLDKDGKEHTLQFAIKNWWISDFTAINNNNLSELLVECVQEANIIQITLDDFYQALNRFPELDKLHKKNLENRISSLEKRILDRLMLTGLERYKVFKKNYSEIEHLIPNYCVASYLGMAKESLSRIRRKNSELT